MLEFGLNLRPAPSPQPVEALDVDISTDMGRTWTNLETFSDASQPTANPVIDLGPYEGRRTLLRFQFITVEPPVNRFQISEPGLIPPIVECG